MTKEFQTQGKLIELNFLGNDFDSFMFGLVDFGGEVISAPAG